MRGPKAQTLHTAGLTIDSHDMPLSVPAAALIVDPTIAFLLITVGLIGLGIELFSPGLIVPGALGAISLLLGLYGTAQLPVTFAGVALLVVAIGLFVAEAHLDTHGILGAGGMSRWSSPACCSSTPAAAASVAAPAAIGDRPVLGGLLLFVVATRRRGRGWSRSAPATRS